MTLSFGSATSFCNISFLLSTLSPFPNQVFEFGGLGRPKIPSRSSVLGILRSQSGQIAHSLNDLTYTVLKLDHELYLRKD